MREGTTTSTRLRALDGVRGVAAVVVVIYHVSLIARPFATGGGRAEAVWTGVTESPLKLLFAGTEAVLVFFVLSGLVVVLPLLRRSTSWAAFFASRLVRLYVPVWGALLLAVALIAVVPRREGAVSSGEWIDEANASSVSVGSFLHEASLAPASYDIVNTLWSLRWELVFTALLPVAIGVALLVRRSLVALVGTGLAAAATTVAGRVLGVDALVYLPVFLLGTLVAVRLDDLLAWARLRPRPLLWSVVGSSSALLLIASWLARPFAPPRTIVSEVLWGFAGLGALGLVIVAVCSPALDRLLSTRIPQWAGRVSFSLYLVHVPVLATIAYAVGDRWWWVVGLVGVPLSFVIAEVFFRLVERPSHVLARRTGRLVGRGVAAARERFARPAIRTSSESRGEPDCVSAAEPLAGREPTLASPRRGRTVAPIARRSAASPRSARRGD
ncbi:acyltransferase [Labedella phragmitis]|uniref:Acyltransferase n=1 Tax=Labedella phragmitis TaxID=2498849 RepID=A0A3S4DND9_9MICO|nr:acyltransferase [Labedella phragmitis]RWZ52411.1 acyltransferase [Labedella phragmitis]